jgi:hypothetical protein
MSKQCRILVTVSFEYWSVSNLLVSAVSFEYWSVIFSHVSLIFVFSLLQVTLGYVYIVCVFILFFFLLQRG